MKRKMIMIAIFCVLLVMPNVVIAQELEVVPYAKVCPLCHKQLKYQTYTYDVVETVYGCANSGVTHTHTTRIAESGYVCITFGCPSEGYYLNKTETILGTTCPLD